MKNIFSKTTEKRTQNGLKTDSKRTNYGIPILIFAFLTLGFGQMWGYETFKEVWLTYDVGNGDEGAAASADKTLGNVSKFTIKAFYINCKDNWGAGKTCWSGGALNYNFNGGGFIEVINNASTWKPNGWTEGDYQFRKEGINTTLVENNSGSYNIKFYGKVWGDHDAYLNNGGSNYTWTFSILPPAVKSGTVSVSATNTVPGSGTGLSSGSPIILISGMASTLTITATQNHTDANSALWCKFGTGSYSSTTTYDIASGTTTSNQTLALAVKYRNNSASLDGAETTTNIYYKWAAPAPAITFGSVTPTTLVSGSDVTLVGTRHNSSNTISFQYSTNDGASWSDITPKTSSLSSNTLTATWTIPEAHDATQTYKFRAKLAEATPIYSSASSAVTVYGKKTIHVRNTNDWATFKMHHWGDANPTSMPGNADNISEYGGQWKDVVILSSYTGFILNDGAASGGHQSYDLSYNDYTDDAYYAFATNSTYTGGAYKHTLSSSSAPAVPTATTNDANEITSTTAKFNYSVNANRDKTTPGIAFKQSDDDIDAATIYSSGTKVAGSAILDGNTSGATAAQTITPGKKYYYVAYGTNGFGTSYGTVKSFVAPYKVTITKPTGCSAITPGAGTQYVHIGDEISSTAATGYTFSSWSLSKVTLSSPTTTTGVTTSNITAISADNGAIQPVYTENMTTVNLIASPADKGTFTSGGTVTFVSAGVDTHPTVTAVPGTGYHLTGTIWSESSTYISISATNSASTTITATGTKGNSANLTATFTPNTYKVQFHRNGGAGDVVKQDFTYDVAQNLAANTYTKTGYTFAGWALTTDGAVTYTDGAEVSNLTATQGATFDLYAKWTPKQSALTFDYQTSAEGYGAEGTLSAVSATYGAAMPALSGSMPTAANGYCFMGFFSETGGNGTKYYNADKSSAHNWDVDTESGTTLYAYYKKAEITGITFTPGNIVAPGATVTVTATIEPTPVGPTTICWRVLYSNDNPLDPQPTFTPEASGAIVSFPAHSASGSYKVEATLSKGTGCGGEEIHTFTAPFQVAGDHTVTVQYKCGSEVIAPSTTVTGKPLQWTEITAPEIVGYSFSKWVEGDGITIEGATNGEKASATINFKAIYDGKLTAVYTQKRVIYFYNTLNWENVYVYFYKDGNYWDNSNGTGTDPSRYSGSHNSAHKGQMLPVTEGSKIYYFDAEGASIPASYTNVAFTEKQQDNCWYFYNNNKVVRRGDYQSTTMPLFVPLSDQPAVSKNGGTANYYCEGYWMNYPANSGYTLRIYDTPGANNATGASREFLIPFSEDVKMPLKQEVEVNFSGESWFIIYRNDGKYLEGEHTFKQTDHGDKKITSTADASTAKKMRLISDGSGIYTFTLSFRGDGDEHYDYYLNVDFPAAVGDYRIVYSDNATWSNGAHGAGWYHPSDIIGKNTSETEAKEDTVSFFISHGSSPSMKFQRISAISESAGSYGKITWEDVPSGSITIPTSITASGVYNFIVTQPAGGASISLVKAEPYTGNYYIRTDCAGETKWNNFRSPDHLITYSEYSITHGGYSHYYCHWVTTADTKRKNVKFCIANDYSPCISDTLTRETASGEWANINSFIEENGNLKRSANVRFMWNQSTNKISRAYLDPAKNDDNFLVLASADSKIANKSEVVQTAVVFSDNENWIYEANVKAKPGAEVKLVATWGDASPIVQYFKGTESTTETLITGSTDDWYDIRLVYDYKTNRLIAAMLPSGNHTTSEPINADVMFIREHQGDISQVTFTKDGALTDIKIAYGVMRFNKWTLNNKDKDTHLPLASPASPYERAMYFISFPFEVKLSEVFGIGNYGQDWIVEYYDGAERARTGWWEGEPGFWRYVWNRKDFVLKPNVGYLLQLELASFGEESSAWDNDNERLELFFPSSGNLGTITNTTVNCTIPEHACTINRHETEGLPDTPDNPHTSYNRTIFDSHWNVMSVPTYVNANNPSFANTTWIGGGEGNVGPKFLYTWNPDDNTLTATSGTGFMYHAMHAYMVQYSGNVQWVTSGTGPASIVARDTYAEQPKEVEFRIEIQQNEKMVDQTFVIMSNDDEINANFQFGEDMSKDFNARNANIYTMTADNVASAGNSLPMSETTTIVPVGVSIKSAGDYTFAIPEGTEGIGVTLVDNETGVRTSLSALSYTVNLTAGDYTGRFVLEISPIAQTPTGVETVTGEGLPVTGVRKVMIDGILYIVKDGKMYDARGARVQ